MPGWIATLIFAEQFGINPDEVASRVSIETWQRWQILMKAKAARDVWQTWRSPGKKDFDAGQQQLFNWPVGDGY